MKPITDLSVERVNSDQSALFNNPLNSAQILAGNGRFFKFQYRMVSRSVLLTTLVHTHCFPGARVLDVSAQIPAILKDDESVGAVVLHAGVNDTKLRQTETLKRDFRSLIETVRSTSPVTTIIVSGPLPMYRRGHERFSRLFALNEWLLSWCKEQKLLFVNNWNLF